MNIECQDFPLKCQLFGSLFEYEFEVYHHLIHPE